MRFKKKLELTKTVTMELENVKFISYGFENITEQNIATWKSF